LLRLLRSLEHVEFEICYFAVENYTRIV
jgi:hypothetical protein